jgi:hypothetical protein
LLLKSYCEESDQDQEIGQHHLDQNDDDDTNDNDHHIRFNQKKQKNVQISNSSDQIKPLIDDQNNVETIEKILKYRLGKVGETGSKTAFYNEPETTTTTTTADTDYELKKEDQYLIKWQGWSHLHNTWETKENLIKQKVKGIKKLENYLKKEDEVRKWKEMSGASPEDIEYYECQLEMLDNLLDEHKNVERIIASNEIKNEIYGTSSIDVLCKWKGLPYSECTWEDGDLIKKLFPNVVRQFEVREQVETLPNFKNHRVQRQRPKFNHIKEQPSYLGDNNDALKLRDYQLDGLNWLANSWCR